MSDIKINFQGIADAVSSMKSAASHYADLLKASSNLHNTMISDWEGSASKAWSSSVNSYICKGQNYVDVLNSFTQYAELIIGEFSQLDSECAALINNSF